MDFTELTNTGSPWRRQLANERDISASTGGTALGPGGSSFHGFLAKEQCPNHAKPLFHLLVCFGMVPHGVGYMGVDLLERN